MLKKLSLLVVVGMLMVSCNSEDYARIQSEVESANQKVEAMNQAQTARYAPNLTESALSSLKEAKDLAKDGFYIEAEPKLESFHSTADQAISKAVSLREASQVKEVAAAPKTTTYKIKRGDWLSKIARRSNGRYTWNEIYQLNKASVKNPNKIYAGRILQLPAN